MTFQAYEIPTGGKPPKIDLRYGRENGRRVVLVNSPWVLLIRRASGAIDPVSRLGGAYLEPGDEVLEPKSATEPVDSRELFRAKLQGYAEYHAAHMSEYDDDDNITKPAPDPDRWWWYRRALPHGRVVHLRPASSNARLSISIEGTMGFEGSWCYADHGDGWRAALGWNGEGDPPDGWHRHLETARRRQDGTAATEYIYAYEGGRGR